MKYSVIIVLLSVALCSGCGNQGKASDIVSNATLKANMATCEKEETEAARYECTFAACNKQTACRSCLNDIYAQEFCQSKEDSACIWKEFGGCIPTQAQIEAEEAANTSTTAEATTTTAEPGKPGPTMSQADKEKYQKDATSCRNIECALNKCENWDKCKPCLEKTKKFCQEEYPDTTPQHCWMNHLMNC